jgi:hypothetical protein
MKLGTRSVLYGYHCFLTHWLFVARGWWHLYGFRPIPVGPTCTTSLLDPRLWLAFIVHDMGYWGKPNMDGEEGEQHPIWGATLMGELFGGEWYTFTMHHSRFMAKRNGVEPSALCFADKLAICFTPDWMFLPMVKATGEVHEYMANVLRLTDASAIPPTPEQWLAGVKDYVWRWVEEHKDGRTDTWTPAPGTGYGSDRPVKASYPDTLVQATGTYYIPYRRVLHVLGRDG